MWIKINNDKKSEFVKPEKILDYNQTFNITSRDVNSATGTLILYGSNNKRITCKPHKTDYPEWLTMLRLSREAIATTPSGYE